MATPGTYKQKKRAGTADRARLATDDPHPLGAVEINWLDGGGVRISFPNSPDMHLKRAYLDGDGRTHILEVAPTPKRTKGS